MLFLLTSTALAGSRLSAQVGTFATTDPSLDVFAGGDAGMGTFGLRFQQELSKNVLLVADYSHGVKGGEVNDAFHSSLAIDQLNVGAKAQVMVGGPHLGPYVTAALMGTRGRLRLDDDVDSDDNPGQVKGAGFAPGAYGAVGGELLAAELPLTFHVEVGANHHLPMGLGNLGTVQFGGLVVRAGLGVRF